MTPEVAVSRMPIPFYLLPAPFLDWTPHHVCGETTLKCGRCAPPSDAQAAALAMGDLFVPQAVCPFTGTFCCLPMWGPGLSPLFRPSRISLSSF